jgi:hypothetical protein
MDSVGRRRIQLQGFALMSATFAALGLAFEQMVITETGRIAMLFLYGLTFFFSNYGPNSTTFILPSETYPEEVSSNPAKHALPGPFCPLRRPYLLTRTLSALCAAFRFRLDVNTLIPRLPVRSAPPSTAFLRPAARWARRSARPPSSRSRMLSPKPTGPAQVRQVSDTDMGYGAPHLDDPIIDSIGSSTGPSQGPHVKHTVKDMGTAQLLNR